MPDDSTGLDAAAEDLYGVLPAEFIAARDARVKAAKSDGDDELAAQIKALRKPSTAAWLVNLLARTDPGLQEFSDLSGRLRDAQTKLDAPAMKQLGQGRTHAVVELVGRAVALAKAADPGFRDSEAVRDQVAATLTAAVADPSAEAAVTSGRLVSPLSYAGFGEVDLTDAVATPLRVVRDREDKPEDEEEEPPPTVDRRALARARKDLERAEQRLEDAEEALAEARARRHRARSDVKQAQRAVEELESP